MAKKSNPNNKPYYAEKYMLSLTGNTKSLNKLELIAECKTVNDEIASYAIAAYLFYCKPDVNKVKYPNLFNHLQLFIKNKNKTTGMDKYAQAEAWIKYKSLESKIEEKNKDDLIKYINKTLEKKDININHAAKIMDIPQPTLYKVLKQNKTSSISIVKLSKIADALEGI